VTFETGGEFIPCWTKTKQPWGHDDCDALSWYLATHRDDKAFRTQMFGKVPQCDRAEGMKAELGTPYEFDVEIRETSASYKINGKLYASCSYSLGEVPKTGHLGFAVCGFTEWRVIKKMEVLQIKSCPVEILEASYGPGLITEKVREMYADDVRTFLPNNQTWGDTQPGVPKALTITYKVGGETVTKKAEEVYF